MFEYINIFLKSVFIDNMIFAYFLGMCSFLAVSKKVSTAIGLGIAVTFVQVITVPLNYLIYHYVLGAGALAWLDPSLAELDLSFLTFILFIASDPGHRKNRYGTGHPFCTGRICPDAFKPGIGRSFFAHAAHCQLPQLTKVEKHPYSQLSQT